MSRKKSVITLYSHVPFDETYKHVMLWKNNNRLEQFLDKFPHVAEYTSIKTLINRFVGTRKKTIISRQVQELTAHKRWLLTP